MAPLAHINEMPVTLRLSDQARAKLAERAAQSGQDVANYASELIEEAVTRPSVDELLAPFRKQVAESGMGDKELDAFYRGQLEEVRRENREKKAKSA
jgi:hypothetical protein